MKIFVFGNADLAVDSLPLRILPELQKRFPHIEFIAADPNEEWDVAGGIIALDTVRGIKEVMQFDSLEQFHAAPRVTGHDFDALSNLRLLAKTGRIQNIKIIGIPPTILEEEALEATTALLKSISDQESARHNSYTDHTHE